jgi:Flp pilus assembly protein TadB
MKVQCGRAVQCAAKRNDAHTSPKKNPTGQRGAGVVVVLVVVGVVVAVVDGVVVGVVVVGVVVVGVVVVDVVVGGRNCSHCTFAPSRNVRLPQLPLRHTPACPV